MNRDPRLKLATIVLALIALVSMSACVVASSPSSLPNTASDPDPTPTAIPETEELDDEDIEIVEDEEHASDAASTADDSISNTRDVNDDANTAGIHTSDDDADLAQNSPHVEEDVAPGRPARMQIDAIDIDAAFEYVGVTEEGNMDVPREWDNVAWYEPGTVPGDRGNAVVAGHYDSDTGPAIFYELNDLAPGDHVRIITGDGSTLVFEITEIETVHIDDVDTSKIFGKTDERNLNLITCEGIWDGSAGMYDQRLIVYTTLISD